MRRNIFVGLMLAGLTGLGCTDTGSDTSAAPSPPTGERASLSKEVPDQDALATQAYARVKDAFAMNRTASVRFPIYSLRPVGDVSLLAQERARVLGLEGGSLKRAEEGVALAAGNWELRMDALSGAELFVDKARFHAGQGVATLPLAEADYIARARAHVSRVLPQLAGHELRPYRVRRYMNDATGPKGERAGASVYQVAVAFHEVLGELPVIGAGGKVAVHLSPQGEVLSHEATVRDTAQRLTEVSGSGLLAPDEAQRRVEQKLSAEGVKLADYRLTRAELGYLRLGRNSVQSVLVPHYAYFYEPASREVVGKKRLELVPAVTDAAVLERLQQDEKAEAERKATLRAHAAPPDSK
jgi:hypothetical protein